MDNQNSLPVIQSLWIGSSLSAMEQLCIYSFLSNGHPFHLYTYGDVKNIPEGTIVKDASKIIGPDKIFKYKNLDTYAGFSNVFRYKLLLEKGSYWVDTDIVCLRPFDDNSDYLFAKSKREKKAGEPSEPFWMESCVIKSPVDSAVMNYCYEESRDRNPNDLKFGEIGPFLLESAIKKYKLEEHIAKAETFCPVAHTNWKRLINGQHIISLIEEARMILHRSKGLHLWNEMWRQGRIDKNAKFPENCIYEKLKRRYSENIKT